MFWASWRQHSGAPRYALLLPPHPAKAASVVIAAKPARPRQGVCVTLTSHDTLRLTSPATGGDLTGATVTTRLAADASQAAGVLQAVASALYAARAVAGLATARDKATEQARRLEYEFYLTATDTQDAEQLADQRAQQAELARVEAERDQLIREHGAGADLDDYYALSKDVAALTTAAKHAQRGPSRDTATLQATEKQLHIARRRLAIAFRLDTARERLADARALAASRAQVTEMTQRITRIAAAVSRPDAPTPPVALPELDAPSTTPRRKPAPPPEVPANSAARHRPDPVGL